MSHGRATRLGAARSFVTAATLAGCGTTSCLEAPAERGNIDLNAYSRLLVEDFKDLSLLRLTPPARACR